MDFYFGCRKAYRNVLTWSTLSVIILQAHAGSAWISNSSINDQIVNVAGRKGEIRAVSDGAGGKIITWEDGRNSNGGADVYAQRINSAGVPLWAPGGVVVSSAVEYQLNPCPVPDGSGGVIVTWMDNRDQTQPYFDVRAQRLDAQGNRLWHPDGIVVSGAARDQTNPESVSDGAGGAIVVWEDTRAAQFNADIYAQRINSQGAAQWTANGVAVCTAAQDQDHPVLVLDNSGGVIITWEDWRTNAHHDVYAQRLSSAGAALWASNGVPVATGTINQWKVRICTDGAGGAYILWQYYSDLVYDPNLKIQRIIPQGAMAFAGGGVVVTEATDVQQYAELAYDSAGGAIVAWEDGRDTFLEKDVYAQKITGTGQVAWAVNGTLVATASDSLTLPTIVGDGVGGGVVVWADGRSSTGEDVYGQRISSSGQTMWGANGAAISNASGDQVYPEVFSDDSEGVVVLWGDGRTAIQHIYGSRVLMSGDLSSESRVVDWAVY